MINLEREPIETTAVKNVGEVPSWVNDAARDYKKATNGRVLETSFFRGNKSIEAIDWLLPKLNHKPNILIVGCGLDSDPLLCCYEPFKIGAHFEGKGLDYSMTLVDVDKRVIDDIHNRKTLYLSCRQFGFELREDYEKEWEIYLDNTKQMGSETKVLEPGLNFHSCYLDKKCPVPYTRYLNHGILKANVSPFLSIN